MKPLMFVMAVLVSVGLSVPMPADAGMRCGNRLVTEGDLWSTVLKKCGAPTYNTNSQLNYYPPYEYESRNVERWIYDGAPNRFTNRLIINNGKVQRIERQREW